MRFLLLSLFASVTVVPFNCGEQPQNFRSSETNETGLAQGEQFSRTADSSPPGKSPRVDSDDALVPPLAFHPGEASSLDQLTPTDFTEFDFSSDDRAQFHAHGNKVCASGCAASRHPTEKLTKAKYLWLLRRFAEQPLDESSPALEALLYYGRQTLVWMNKLGTKPLDARRVQFLRHQLRRTHALISFRIVDEFGITRVFMPPTRVPLDRRHEFRMETTDLPPLITSGTVKRVGLHHLWTRL